MTSQKPRTVDEYIRLAPEEAQPKLRELRALLHEVAPEAQESIKWGSPIFEEKRILFSFSAHKTHINFMPTRLTLDSFRDELTDYTIGRDTIQLPYDKPLPLQLLRKIALHRAHDVRENDARWM